MTASKLLRRYMNLLDENEINIGFLTKRDEIEEFCSYYNIFAPSIHSDGSVDVLGNVDLSPVKIVGSGINNRPPMHYLPIKFGHVSGSFICAYNKLKNLQGTPITVGDFFDCSNNSLSSFYGCPQKIGGNFLCYQNKFRFTLENYIELLKSNILGKLEIGNSQIERIFNRPRERSRDKLTIINQLRNFEPELDPRYE